MKDKFQDLAAKDVGVGPNHSPGQCFKEQLGFEDANTAQEAYDSIPSVGDRLFKDTSDDELEAKNEAREVARLTKIIAGLCQKYASHIVRLADNPKKGDAQMLAEVLRKLSNIIG